MDEIVRSRAPKLADYAARAKQDQLIRTGQLTNLPSDAAIDVYLQRQEWDQAYDLAEKAGEAQEQRVASVHARCARHTRRVHAGC